METLLADKIANLFKSSYLKGNLKRSASHMRLNSGYTSTLGNVRGLMDWLPSIHSGNSELTESESNTLMGRAGDAVRNHELAKAVVERYKHGVIATGLRANPSIDGDYLGLNDDQVDDLENTIEVEFGFARKTCDAEGVQSFEEKQALAWLTSMVYGGSFANIFHKKRRNDIYGVKIQDIDPARVLNPDKTFDTKTLKRGIELDTFGSPIAYHVLRAHPADFGVVGEEAYIWDRIPAFGRQTGRKKFLQLFEKDRVAAARGVSILAPILSSLKQLKRYNDAELMAAVLNSFMTFFVTNENDEEDPVLPVITGDTRDPLKRNTIDISPGAVVQLSQGQKVEPFQPTRPTNTFDSFINSISRYTSASLSIPMEEVLLVFNESFSAARAAMIKAWEVYNVKRQVVANQYCQPFYSAWFDEAVAQNALPHITGYGDERRRMAYQNCNWIGPARGAIDEKKQVDAGVARVANGFSSLQVEAQQISGMSTREIAKQNRKAKKHLGFGADEIRSSRNILVEELADEEGNPIDPDTVDQNGNPIDPGKEKSGDE